jgi:hypothetical protein
MYRRALTQPEYGNANLPPFGLWRSLVARSVRVGEVAGSNPVSPILKKARGAASALKFAIVRESVLDRHRVSKDTPDAVTIVAMLDRTAERAAGSGDRHALLWNLKGYVNNARPRVRIRAAP